MVAITVAQFSGMAPLVDPRSLPDTAGVVAINMKMGSGALESVRAPRLLFTLPLTTRFVYHIPGPVPYDMAQGFWVQLGDPDTDMVRTPVVNDSYERYYWASPSTGFRYATRAQLVSGQPSMAVGVMRPTSQITLDVIAGTGAIGSDGKNTGTKVSRSYFVTFVTEYGEEGAPGPSSEAVGAADQDWRLRDIPQPVNGQGRATVTKIRVYRSVTSLAGNTTFNRVIDLAVGTLIYVDRASDLTISGNSELDSLEADPPPDGMQGLALMPNGVMVGFKDNNLYFSENFKPHSWPAAYTLTVTHPIVGLGVYGTTCVVATQGRPAMVTGNTGASMTLTAPEVAMPCLSRQSIAVAPEGVYWATAEGLALWTPSGMSLVTDALIGRQLWVERHQPQAIDAVIVNGQYTYVTGGLTEVGYTFPVGCVVSLEGLDNPSAEPTRIGMDVWSGRPWMLFNGALFEWLPATGAPMGYRWRSKEFQTPEPVNMSCVQAFFDVDPSIGTDTCTITVYAAGNPVFAADMKNGEIRRLPKGFKSDIWQIDIAGFHRFHKATMATTIQELKAV